MIIVIIWLSDIYINNKFIVYISIIFRNCILSVCYPDLWIMSRRNYDVLSWKLVYLNGWENMMILDHQSS